MNPAIVLAFLQTVAPGQAAHVARQGDMVILQLTPEQCAAPPRIFDHPYQCDADGRLVIGVDFRTPPETYGLEGTPHTLIVREEAFDTVWRQRRGRIRKMDPEKRGEEERLMTEAFSGGPRKYPNFPATVPFHAPLEIMTVTDPFGLKRMYWRRTRKDAKLDQHRGADLRAPHGTPVAAVAQGAVMLAHEFTEGREGKMVILYHGSGIYSLYLHNSKFNCLVGQIVGGGDIIAYSGDSGAKGQPHLHFAVKVSGATVDPLSFIETFNVSLAPSGKE